MKLQIESMRIYLLLFLLSLASCKSRAVQGPMLRKNYQRNLEMVLNKIHLENGIQSLEKVIPITQDEATIYFSLDYDKIRTDQLRVMRKKLVELCKGGNTRILSKYLNLSEFVDGYFAEDYFDDMEVIFNSQKSLSCATLSKSDPNKTNRLNEIKKRYCD